MIFDGAAADVWDRLLFYEQIEGKPPLLLRLLLPLPVGAFGQKKNPGDRSHCVYVGGHLVKRVTGTEPGRRYTFEVAEQALLVGGGLKLRGGSYTLDEVEPGRTRVTVSTTYVSPRSPRWLWRPVEAVVCHAFHRHLLRSMRRGSGRA